VSKLARWRNLSALFCNGGFVMFSGVWIDTAIGVALFFLAMSFMVSSAVEGISQMLAWRANTLRQGIASLFKSVGLNASSDDAATGPNMLKTLYDHSLLRGLCDQQRLGWIKSIGNGKIPSYVPSTIFANALLDIVTINGPTLELKKAHEQWRMAVAAAKSDRAGYAELPAAIDRLLAALKAAKAELAPAHGRQIADIDQRLAALARQEAMAMSGGRIDQVAGIKRFAELTRVDRDRLATQIKARIDTAVAAALPDWAARLPAGGDVAALDRLAADVDIGITDLSALLSEATSQVDRALGDGRALIDQIAFPQLRDTLKTLVGGGQASIDDVRLAAAKWFDTSMERVTGWYKRRIQFFSFVIGLGVAVVINADAINVVQTIATNEKLRGELVALAQTAVKAETETDRAAKLRGEVDRLPIGWYRSTCDLASKAAVSCSEPATWKDLTSFNLRVSLLSVIGWLVTALAMKLGAPFWFDLLSTLIRMRASGKVPPTTSGATGP